MRLRQICLVAEDLENSLLTLSTLLDSPVMFKDPSVAEFGLDNGLIMTGGDFVEIVSPLPDLKNTAAERQLNRCGDSFYMAIFHVKKRSRLSRMSKKLVVVQYGKLTKWVRASIFIQKTSAEPLCQ